MEHQPQRDDHRRRQHRQADDVLPSVGNGPLRQHFLQLARGDQASGEGQRADNHFQRDLHHLEFRQVGNAHVILGNADHRRRQRAKRVAEGGPLGHRGHGHQAEGNAHNRPHRQRHDDPLVFDDLVIAERGGDGQHGAELARQHAVLGRRRRTEPLERQHKQRHRHNIGNVDKLLLKEMVHGFFVLAELEHAQHAVGNQESADHVAEGRGHRHRSENGGKRAVMPAGNDDRRHHHNGVQSVGERHQRRVQKRGHAADHFKSDKSRQHKYIQAIDKIKSHKFLPGISGRCRKAN